MIAPVRPSAPRRAGSEARPTEPTRRARGRTTGGASVDVRMVPAGRGRGHRAGSRLGPVGHGPGELLGAMAFRLPRGAQLLRFPSTDGLSLEGRLTAGAGDRGVVLCHPHPLYGGSMLT